MMDDVEENNRRIDWKDWSEKNKLKRSYRRGGKEEMWMVEREFWPRDRLSHNTVCDKTRVRISKWHVWSQENNMVETE